VVEEISLSIYVNGYEFASMMSSPRNQEALGLGFLKNEGFIESMDEVEVLTTSRNGCCVDIWLDRPLARPEHFTITTGCGGGLTFEEAAGGIEPLKDDLRLDPRKLFDLQRELYAPDSLHAQAGGIHTGGLADGRRVFLKAEDIGRHNTIDRLAGACLLRGISSQGCILLSTGRISSEMLRKGARMGCPIICSRTSPTSLSVGMAEVLGITLVGYARGNRMRVYTHPERLGLEAGTTLPAGVELASTRGSNP
jgi:FdhD protein